jgi:hypothetical protein
MIRNRVSRVFASLFRFFDDLQEIAPFAVPKRFLKIPGKPKLNARRLLGLHEFLEFPV